MGHLRKFGFGYPLVPGDDGLAVLPIGRNFSRTQEKATKVDIYLMEIAARVVEFIHQTRLAYRNMQTGLLENFTTQILR